MTASIPLVDLSLWRNGSHAERAALAATVDRALIDSGFLMVSGHGVASELRAGIRDAVREFFALDPAVKERYATAVGGRGWIPPGKEANGYLLDVELPPDLKESFVSGHDYCSGDADVDTEWFPPNVWPTEVAGLQGLCVSYAAAMRELAAELLTLLAVAAGLPDSWFVDRCIRSPHSFNINRYPALNRIGPVEEGQFRIAPHTDFGTITILDREAGYGGLQVRTREGRWIDAPVIPDAYTINIGDLMARWTGDRWTSTMHRVLPPSTDAPDEELISLIFFFEANLDQVIESFPPPLGRANDYQPVTTSDYLRSKYAAIAVP
ncbi:oxidoreductase, 2OG-Fe(II) oxygenase superfamily [Mycolicibacterium canariasense]|uniref:Oxidoreductase, 2OG-Fe(II) oxygenase superfamily n=1 Tax=Mycolicibacterium canariasense TaxID=228230 RepID=A0A100W957_MYCCR|nr:2-oxoglutarate and iron-dependent oxygenase domain-containing protein [Mycolicibacterium canariasense]MCV7212888.1 isopenicillin N synthase family oxygenase [Mycolicibacterium canariasense]ORV19289.1 oxidoreductase [Mycolicibacterium canariasense]GAS93861.1 oxidoreductase, 2OG-Fe(II) oxygenase superfamily [Mycolicibacterium canariasense]